MMDITKSREEFEIACRNGLINYGLAKFENGEYASESTRAVFSGWLAGRESIEVDLPDFDPYGYPSKLNYDIKQALKNAGVRIK
ncbi:hypothetical protein [Yersinia proxima]|uniref:hypothetical protein n=2 Tax=Yersinia proxima TaxID=2890316 RepID=UPI003D687FF2